MANERTPGSDADDVPGGERPGLEEHDDDVTRVIVPRSFVAAQLDRQSEALHRAGDFYGAARDVVRGGGVSPTLDELREKTRELIEILQGTERCLQRITFADPEVESIRRGP